MQLVEKSILVFTIHNKSFICLDGYNMSLINFTWFKTPYVKETSMDQYIVTDVQEKTRIDIYNGRKLYQ